MKSLLLLPIALILFMSAQSQQMHVKQHNSMVFNADKKLITRSLSDASSPQAKQHPEYGILPYNAQCQQCVELIDKRTSNSRFFIDPNNKDHTFSQQSYFPLHYKKEGEDIWRTIDARLTPASNNQGVYVANNQPVPAKCDMNKLCTSLTVDNYEFEFNKNLTCYFFDENTAYTKKEKGNYADYTLGNEGLQVKNIWKGINMQQVFDAGKIETNFVINAPLQIPISKGWMVLEDHFTLPEGYTFEESENGRHVQDGGFKGDYILKNNKGDVLFVYEKPVYVDAKAFGMKGTYRLQRNGSNYTLQTLVPVEWLNRPDNTFPIVIDPTVWGATKIGNFISSNNPGANMAFTSMELGSCDYHMTVVVPGRSVLTNAYVDFEYTLTYDNTCGSPPEPAPYCTFSQASMQVGCDLCGITAGPFSCNPAQPPYTGTCTTDSNLVPQAHSILINDIAPNFLSCYSGEQCADYQLAFTLKNKDSICGDQCGYLCARGNIWRMTVEASQEIAHPTILSSSDTLTSSAATGNQWYLNDTAIDGATSQTYIAIVPGTYSVTVTDSGGCVTHAQAPVNLNCVSHFTVFDTGLPGDSGIYYANNESLGIDLNYLWNFGDGDTSTLPFPTHNYSTPGIYNVCLTVSNQNCTDTYCDSTFYSFKTEKGPMSKLIVISPTGIEDLGEGKSIKIYPDPTMGKLMVVPINISPIKFYIYDISGKKIMAEKYSQQVDVSSLAPGIYFIEIICTSGKVKRRFVKI